MTGPADCFTQGRFDQLLGGDRRSPVSASGQAEPGDGARLGFDVEVVDLDGGSADMAMADCFIDASDGDELRRNLQIQPGRDVFDHAYDRGGAASVRQ